MNYTESDPQFWQTITITAYPNRQPEPYQIEAHVHGDWAVHLPRLSPNYRNEGFLWGVTHISSGILVCVSRELDSATKAAKILDALEKPNIVMVEDPNEELGYKADGALLVEWVAMVAAAFLAEFGDDEIYMVGAYRLIAVKDVIAHHQKMLKEEGQNERTA